MPGNSPLSKTQSEPDLDVQGEHERVTNITTRFKRKHGNDLMSEMAHFREEMKSMMVSMMDTQLAEIRKNSDTLKEIQASNRNIETSIEFLSAQNVEVNKKIERLEKQSSDDKNHIIFLEQKLEEVLKNSREANYEIKNVPKNSTESKSDLIEFVLNLSRTIECPMTRADIRDIYRVRGKPNGSLATPIIVELSSTVIKNDTLKMCKMYNSKHSEKLRAKHLGVSSSGETPIYVSEQLTPKAARLYFLARELKRQKLYNFCWTGYGNVYLRKDEGSPVVQVTSEAQVMHLSKQT